MESATLRYRIAQRSDDIVHECTSHVCIARQAQTQLTKTLTWTRIIGQHAVQQTRQNSDNHLKDGQLVIWLLPPERPRIDGQSATSRRQGDAVPSNTCNWLYNTSFIGHIRCHLVCFCTLPTQHPPCSSWQWWQQRHGRASWVASSAVPMSCRDDRSVQIVRFWSTSVHGVWSVHSP